MTFSIVISRTHLERARQKAEFERLGLSWEHWRCKRCHGHGKVEIHGTGKYDSDNDWGPCPEDPPESQWGPAPKDGT
jgi:hypothetical protein